LLGGLFGFSEHIEEFRRRLRITLSALLVILIVLVLVPANPVYQSQHLDQYLNLQFLAHTVTAAFLQAVVSYVLPSGWTLIAANGIGEGMEIYFVAALLLTLVIGMPAIAYETYRFIDPALKPTERKLVYPFVASTSALLVAGALFGFYVLAKFLIIALSPFFVATSTSFQIDSAAFYYVVFLIVGATGVSFTSPVFVYTLIRLRVLDADFFSKNRVVIWFIIWVVTGLFLTPDGGPLLDLVIFVPIVAMVEIAVALARRSVKGTSEERSGIRDLRCPSCGVKLDHPALFCPSCGKSVA
jgi:sec-independent protein translocase protein TatC